MMNKSSLFYAAFIVVLAGILAYSYLSGPLSYDLLGFVIFIFILGSLIYKDRSKVKFQGLAFIRRTDRVNKLIDRQAKKYPSFWRVLAIIGIGTAIVTMVLGSWFMISTAADIVSGKIQVGGAGIVLPGPVSNPVAGPGVFVVPWWIWVIAIIVVMIPHEFMHGIMFRLQNVRIKSVGWVVLLFLPGAFVEPDEKQFAKSKTNTKLKVLAAGTFANFLSALIVFLIITAILFSGPVSQSAGVFATKIEGYPAADANISSVITKIDGIPVRSQDDVVRLLSDKAPGDVVFVTTAEYENLKPSFTGEFSTVLPKASLIADLKEEKTYQIVLEEVEDKPGKGFLGIANVLEVREQEDSARLSFINLLVWIYVFSFGIGLFNMLPIKPLDGGLFFQAVAEKYTKRGARIANVVTIIMVIIVLINIFGTFIF